MHRDRRRAAALTIALSLAAATLAANPDNQSHVQEPYALLFGTIFGPNDHPLYGARITIRRSDQKKPKWELWSNHEGEFAQRVPAGKADYIVTAEIKVPKGQPKPELTIHIENDERKDFAMHFMHLK